MGEVSARWRWLVEPAGGNLGRTTTAQMEFVGIYEQRVSDWQTRLDALWKGGLTKLNAGLQAAGTTPLPTDGRPRHAPGSFAECGTLVWGTEPWRTGVPQFSRHRWSMTRRLPGRCDIAGR